MIITWTTWEAICLIFLLIKKSNLLLIKQILNRVFYSDNVYKFIDEKNRNKKEISIFGWGIGKKGRKYFIAILNISIYWTMLLNGTKESYKNRTVFMQQLEKRIKYINRENDPAGLDLILIPICYSIEYLCNEKNNIYNCYKIDDKKWRNIISNKDYQKFIKAIISDIRSLGSKEDISNKLEKFFSTI